MKNEGGDGYLCGRCKGKDREGAEEETFHSLAAIAQEVFVLHRSLDSVGYGSLASMGVIWEPSSTFDRRVV